MKYKYTIRDYKELKAKLQSAPTHDEVIALLQESDTLSKVLFLDELYRTPDSRAFDMVMEILEKLNDAPTMLIFAKHTGIDFDAFSKNIDEFKPNPLLGAFNVPKHIFDTKLINTIRKIAKQKPNILEMTSEKYHSLVINNIDDFIREYINLDYKSNPFDTIKELLCAKDVTVEQKQMIFDKVLSKNEFASFDYDSLAEQDFTPFTQVRGLFNKLSSKATRYVISLTHAVELMERENIPRNEIGNTMLNRMLGVIRCNKSSPEEIQKLFMKLEYARCDETKTLLKMLADTEEYKQIKPTVNFSMNRNFIERIKERITGQQPLPEKVSNKILSDLLSGKSSIEFEVFSTEFAKSKIMQKNQKQLLSVLMSEKLDDKTQKLLATTLLVGLSEKLKKDLDLEYEFVFNDTEMANNTLGSYDHHDKKLYFNKFFIYGQKDWKKGFVQGINTIYHELQHAKQFQHDIKTQEWNYDIIQQSMDHYMSNQVLNQKYYQSNYRYISYEADARAKSYVNTMNYFEDYPEFQEIVRKDLDEDMDKIRLRCREGYQMQYFQGFDFLLGTFMQSVNFALQGHALSADEEARKNKTKPLDEIYEAYPSLQLIFDYNEETNEIGLKSQEYFQTKLAEFQKDPEKNSEAIYCIQNILYDNSVKDKFAVLNANDDFIYSEDEQARQATINEMFEKVSQEIPKPPERKIA